MKLRLTWRRRYPHPLAKVWRALTDPAALAAWLMPNDFAPIVGHRFSLFGATLSTSIIECVVAEIDPLARVSFTWRDGDVDGFIAFDLAPDGDGTRVDLVMIGASPLLPEDAPDRIGIVLDRLVVDPMGHVWSFARNEKEEPWPSREENPPSTASSPT